MGRCITVVGTHSSGTSLVAGVLHRLGVDMGDTLYRPDHNNPLGYYEDAELVELNRKVVDWMQPRKVAFLPEDARAYRKLIRDRAHKHLWGVKDPRLCLVGQRWLNALEDERVPWRLVLVVRSADASTESLMARERLSRRRAAAITKVHLDGMWSMYFQHFERALIICYGTMLERPTETIERLAEFVGVEPTKDGWLAAKGFVHPEMCHHGV